MTRYINHEELKKKKTRCLSREIAGCTFPINQNTMRRFFAFAHTLIYWRRNFAITFNFCAYLIERSRSWHNRIRASSIDFEPLGVWNTMRVLTRVYTYMYVSMPLCATICFTPVTFTISFWASASRFYAASNSNVSHLDRDLDLLSFLSPLCCAHASCRADDTLPK